MALIVKDRVKETTTTTGTGTVTLAGAEDGFQSFSVIGDASTTYYAIVSGNNWEVGLGTYTSSGTTLSRTTILESSNSGSAITLSGTSDVFCTYPAEKAVTLNGTVINDANVVATANIVDDAVTADKLADAINTAISDNTAKVTNATHTGDVTGATALTIGADKVLTSMILDANVTAAKLATDAVTTVKILDANVTTAKMADDSVNATKLNVTGDGTSGQALTSDADGSMTWTTVQSYDADTAKTDVVQTFTTAQRGAITALSDGATITPDMNDSNNFSVTLGGNRTLANPTNITVGQVGSIFVTQDGTGSRTLAYGAYWDFIAATAPVLTTTASAVDRIDYVVRTATSIQAVVTLAYS